MMRMKKSPQLDPSSGRALLSVEFFPPKNETMAEKLMDAAACIQAFHPDFASVTYGAGGSTRESTIEYANKLAKKFKFKVMPHLTCVGHSKQELIETILEFKAMGIQKIMALRGDPLRATRILNPIPTVFVMLMNW